MRGKDAQSRGPHSGMQNTKVLLTASARGQGSAQRGPGFLKTTRVPQPAYPQTSQVSPAIISTLQLKGFFYTK